jgi:DNA polymerase (family 10)
VGDTKQDVLDMLRELAELTVLDEAEPQSFRVRAYESAAQAIAAQATDLGKLTAKELQQIHGIGKSTADKIRELLETGHVAKLEALRAKHPAGVVALLRIPGLGPKAVRKLRAELGVESLEDLRRALAEQRLRGLAGFGAKSEERIAQALARLEAEGSLARTPIAVALPLATRIVERLRELPGVVHAEACGSLRRFAETVGDLDVVVATSDPAPVMEAFVALPAVERVLGRGDSKASAVTRRGLQIDLRVVAPHQLGAALLYFTGSKGHNIELRQRALARGLTLNEYALSTVDGGRAVASATEAEIYAALDLPWISPVLREGAGEIDAAERGALPAPIGEVTGDFHVHTDLSGDGRSTLDEVVAAARARGCRVLAITEHAEGTRAGVGREAMLAQRARIRALQAELGAALRLLHGVELNIGPNGELDYDAEFRRSFDWCLASVHDRFELDRAAQTRRVVAAMQDPSVRMIGHLSARLIGARPPIELDLDAVFAAAEATGTALEVNGGLPRLDLSVDAIRRASGRDVTFVLTSDAHHARELERVRYAVSNAERAWLAPERVANAWPPEQLAAWATGPKR